MYKNVIIKEGSKVARALQGVDATSIYETLVSMYGEETRENSQFLGGILLEIPEEVYTTTHRITGEKISFPYAVRAHLFMRAFKACKAGSQERNWIDEISIPKNMQLYFTISNMIKKIKTANKSKKLKVPRIQEPISEIPAEQLIGA